MDEKIIGAFELIGINCPQLAADLIEIFVYFVLFTVIFSAVSEIRRSSS